MIQIIIVSKLHSSVIKYGLPLSLSPAKLISRFITNKAHMAIVNAMTFIFQFPKNNDNDGSIQSQNKKKDKINVIFMYLHGWRIFYTCGFLPKTCFLLSVDILLNGMIIQINLKF